MNKTAQALGRLGRGKLKTLSPEERERRRLAMVRLNEQRRQKKGTQ